jgi:hypothetical protein
MEYQRARDIRGRSLSSLIRANLSAGSTVTSSVKRALSQKVRARGTAIKEKFDPLNIVRFMTGGSRLATTVAGKLTGRKRSDIEYFTRGKKAKKSYSTMNKSMPGQLDSSSVGLLSDILNFMKQTHEDDMQRYETQRAFQEEKENEDQRRHENFISVLQQYVNTTGLTPEKKEKEDTEGIFSKMLTALKSVVSGIFDAMKNIVSTIFKGVVTMLSKLMGKVTSLITTLFSGMKKIVGALIAKLLKSLSWLKIFKSVGKIGQFLKYLAPFMKNLLKFGATLLPYLIRFGGPAALAVGLLLAGRSLLQAVADATPNMNALTPQESLNVLQAGNIRDMMAQTRKTDPFQAYMQLVKNVIEGKDTAKKLLQAFEENPDDDTLKKAIKDMGGLDKVKEIAASPDINFSQIPKFEDIISQMRESVEPVSSFVRGATGEALAKKREKWMQQYGSFYDPDTGVRFDLMDVEGPYRRELPGARVRGSYDFKDSYLTDGSIPLDYDQSSVDMMGTRMTEVSRTPSDFSQVPDYGNALTQMQGNPQNIGLIIEEVGSDGSTIVNRSSNPVPLRNEPRPVAASTRNPEPTLNSVTRERKRFFRK